jgi:hypothetical protein
MGIGRSQAELAEHFGRIGRSVFAGETWDECNASLRKSWNLFDSGLAWDDALEDIQRGWAEAPDRQRTAA